MRFSRTTYDDPHGKLFKLQQTTTVTTYLSKFKSIVNCIVGLSAYDLLSCSVSGLKSEVHREVLTQQLVSLLQAASLARLQEDKLSDLFHLSR